MADNKAKRWVFTLNHWTQADVDRLTQLFEAGQALQYLVFQSEVGHEEHTPHLQGFLILKSPKRLSWMRNNVSDRAHFEVARGTNQQCKEYCTKDDTFSGDVRKELGEFQQAEAPKAKERLALAAEELDLVKEGYKRPREISTYALLQAGFIQAYKELTTDILGPYRDSLKIITMVGRPGTGKSFAIHQFWPDAGRCIFGNNGVWFQNPTAKTMVFEEYNGQIQLQRMLQYLDPYPMALEVKGRMAPAMYDTVVITSNTRPDSWYKADEAGMPGKRTDAILALWDRLGFNGGGYVPVRTCGHYLEPPDGLSIADTRKWFHDQIARIINWVEPIDD